MLIGAINPYEFHARTIGAAASVMIADRVVTALPTDGASGLDGLRPEDVPRTLETVRAWTWSSALWREGVMIGSIDGSSPLEDVETLCREIEGADAWDAIRPMVSADLFRETRGRVEAIARDLKHGGIHPGVSVPVTCGVSRFAGRHGLLLFRSPAASTVTKLEAAETNAVARCAVPVLEGLSAPNILALRAVLEEELSVLRGAIVEVIETSRSVGVVEEDLRGLERDVLQPAASALDEAFASHQRVLTERAEDAGDRYRVRPVTLTVGHADPDGVLHAAALAASSLRSGGRGAARPRTSRDAGLELGPRRLTVCGVTLRRLQEAG